MDLAKQRLDVGLYTNRAEEMLEFWRDTVGLPFEEMLPLGGGVRQYRHAMNGSVMKINCARDPLPDATPSGYRELLIARESTRATKQLTDPDGNSVTLVPQGHDGIAGIMVHLAVSDAAAHGRFYGDALEWDPCGDHTYRCGDSLVRFGESPDAAPVGPMQAPGFRYLTVQVRDVDAEHAGIIARGGREGRAPLTLGTTARISFVRDPDGNWIEISQRASLTGPLPER